MASAQAAVAQQPNVSAAVATVTAASLPPDPRYYAQVPIRNFYASKLTSEFYASLEQRNFYTQLPVRWFYASLPIRYFYAPCRANMTALFDVKDPRETVVLTFDATNDLAAGETLSGTPQVSITITRGTDPTPQLVLADVAINALALTVANNTIAIGAGVQAVASAGLSGTWYLIAITCATSNPDKVLTLKATLPVSSS